MAAECISAIILCIIWSYSRKGSLLPSLKNRLFQSCFFVTFLAMLSNIISTWMLEHIQNVSLFALKTITYIYFIFTPLMGLVYFYYTAAFVYEKRKGLSKIIGWCSLPGLFYFVMVLLNPFTQWLFYISSDGIYNRGSYIFATYLVFYFYCIAVVVLVVVKRNWIDPPIRRILGSFPAIAAGVIIFQQVYPSIILSGSAATCALLLIYLFLQNKQISIDYLTNISNRQEFLKMLEFQIKKWKEDHFFIIVLSLRDFKQINDMFGQASGDAFLQAISEYLSTVVEPRYLYRFAGDEFAILIPGDNEEHVRHLLEQLKDRMTKPWNAKEFSCVIRAVIGAVRYPESAQSVERLINGIEFAVSQAKKSGKNVYYCGPEALEEIDRKVRIVQILRKKMNQRELELYYQPIWDVQARHFVLAESLLRIPTSSLGPIYPSEFVPIAEESGLIIEITYQVLHKVCQFINRLLQEGISFEGIHVNFSGVQFTQSDLVEKVSEILEQNKTPNTKLKIEITESVLAENHQVVFDFAKKMRERGVTLELDDFGTGYSNMVSVMTTPLEIVKLDKNVIWYSMEEGRSAMMIKNLTQGFHELGMRVLAEGVETEAQYRYAVEWGIDLIQGYFFAKPMPEEEIISFLKNKNKQ